MKRRKSYSAAVIDGIKRKSRIFVGDSMVRKTDSRLSKGEDVIVCLPGARLEHVTERVEQVMGKGRYDGYSEEIPGSTQEDEASESWPDHSVRDSTRDRRQEPRIQEFDEVGDQQTSTVAMQGTGRGIRGFVEQLCGEGGGVYEDGYQINNNCRMTLIN